MRQTDYLELGNEAVRICQELIRIPSVNHGSGVGDELAISDYVFDFLTRCGLKPIRYQAGCTRFRHHCRWCCGDCRKLYPAFSPYTATVKTTSHTK